jgi:NAD(P)-dependent dehydrogenase (short-subunit alcohol dehydrogenase family)
MISEAQNQTLENLSSLEGKRILLTGGTTGIGRAIALRLAGDGCQLFTFGRSQEDLDTALQAVKDAGGDMDGITIDQAKQEDVDRLFEEIENRWGGLDILINNAALPAETIETTEDWRYVLDANLGGYLACTQKALKLMEEGADILNIGSMSAKVREENADVYVATKTGIEGWSDSLAKQLNPKGIRVTLIEPGLVDTDLLSIPKEERPEKLEKMEMLPADDIAECVYFCLTMPKRCAITRVHVRPLKQPI